MYQKIIIFLICCLPIFASAQIKGLVQGTNSISLKPIYNAKVKLLAAERVVFTAEDGTFEIFLSKALPDTLVIMAEGYYADSIILFEKDKYSALSVILQNNQSFQEIVVNHDRIGHGISKMKTLHVEELTASELRKAACCNLSESFETNASVDVSISDAVSGAKKIQMMGIDGVYTQIQLENIPYLRGLESSFGLQSIPGTWIESIQITKGTGSVVNGYESMAGLVNLEFKKPKEMEKFFVNTYQSILGRSELNLDASHQINDKWSTAWFAHTAGMFGNVDHNKDGFRDVPMSKLFALHNRWFYQGKKMEAQIGITANLDDKIGGQTSFFQNNPIGYGVVIANKHLDLFGKTGFFGKKPMQSLGIIYQFKIHQLDGQFGSRIFEGDEKRAYMNVIYDDIIGTSDHKIKTGVTFVGVSIQQKVDALIQNREELVMGSFAEYTYTGSRSSVVMGLRADYHSLFAWQISPRIHAKYALTPHTDLRFTSGKGWRTPNYIIDNISLLASNKYWIAPTQILPEIAWNIGGSLVQDFKIFKNKASISVDYYRTNFNNQLVVDREETSNAITFKNLSNASYSNAFQTELQFSPKKYLDIRLAYKLLDVKSVFAGQNQAQVMIPRHRGFLNIAYKTRNQRWLFDFTCSVFGSARLPNDGIDPIFNLPASSPVYGLFNSQITHVYKKWNFYIGGENLGNFTQDNPIVSAQNPNNIYFDATKIWGPIMGRNLYLGMRYEIKKKNSDKTITF